jgi:hypothetical protein
MFSARKLKFLILSVRTRRAINGAKLRFWGRKLACGLFFDLLEPDDLVGLDWRLLPVTDVPIAKKLAAEPGLFLCLIDIMKLQIYELYEDLTDHFGLVLILIVRNISARNI